MKYVNTDANRRVWSNIQLPDGTTLELGPGEAVDIEGPRIKDTVLKPAKPTKKEQTEQKKEQKDDDAAAAVDAVADDVAVTADTEEKPSGDAPV
jgi:hypothetical protein